MSQGILEDEGDEASDQKKEVLKTRLENGAQQIESSRIISQSNSGLLSSSSHDDITSSSPDLSQHVFGSQSRSQSETSQRQRDARDVDSHPNSPHPPDSPSNYTLQVRNPDSREEDEGGGPPDDSSSNQFIDETPSSPSDVEHDQAISQFIAITGVNPERGKLYLTNTGWDLDLAIASYFEEADETAEELVTQRDQFSQEEAVAAAAQTTPNFFTPPVSGQPPPMSDSNKKPRRGIATLSSLRNGEEDDDDDDKQAFYAGGSDHSGQQILGPNKKQDPNKLVKEMFNSAKEHGGQVVDSSESSSNPTSREQFGGSGFRLGSELGEQSEFIPGSSSGSSSQQSTVDIVLKLWRNGFSVDDGPLRAYEDPTNAEFLRSIKQGEIPRELTAAARAEVSLNMEDHRDEEYVMVKKPVKAFGGEGQRLGNVAPVTSGSGAPPPSSSPLDMQSAQKLMEVDESKPSTSIQIRLSDGTRMVVKVNVDQKVRKIREFICAARPSEAAREFQLMTTFPNKVVEDEDATVDEAGLKSASIVQKLI